MNVLTKLPARFRGDSAISILDQILVSGLNFSIGIAAARMLGVADFGLFTLILMIANLAGVASGHILSLPMVTLAGSRPNRSEAYFSTILRLGIAVCLGFGLTVGIIIWSIGALRGEPVGAAVIGAAAFLAFGQNIQILVRSVLFVRRSYRMALLLDLQRICLLLSALVGVGFWTDWHVGVAPVLALIGSSALIVALPSLIAAAGTPARPGMALHVLNRHWPLSKWMLLMMLVSLGQEQALWVIVGLQMGDTALGALRAGQYILGTTNFLVLAFENFVPRNAAEEFRRSGERGLRAYLSRQTVIFGGTTALLILLIAIFAQPLLGVFFGQSYEAYADITRILAIAYVATVIRTIWSYYLRSVERTNAIFWSFAVSSATSIAIIYPAIARMGVEGVAWTMCIAQVVCLSLVGIAVAVRSSAASSVDVKRDGETRARPVVEFVSLVLSHYRVRFHALVREDLARDGIDYRLTYSDPTGADAQKSDTGELPWAKKVPVRSFSVHGQRLYWQPAWKAARDADLVVIGQENKLLFNYWLMLRRLVGGPRLAFFGHGKNYQSGHPNGARERLKRLTAKRVHWWFAYTPGVADLLAGYGFPRERITVNYNAIDSHALRADLDAVTASDIAAAKRALGIESDNIGIYVGGMYVEKRLDFLVEAARLIRQRVPDFHLLLVGGGSHRQIAEDAARNHSFIHAIGPRFGHEKAVLLKASKLFLMPGLVGLAILDSFAAGCPLVTTDVPFHSPEIDYLRDGENGVIVKNADDPSAYAAAVAALLLDETHRGRLAQAARTCADAYTIERMAKSVADGIRLALA